MTTFTCPNCYAELDGHMSVDGEDRDLEPRDITVCLYCGAPVVVQKDRTLRFLTEAEVARLPDEIFAAIETAQLVVKAFAKKHGVDVRLN